jgi:aryl-alcohol dehydrogenase-like predicted oxidoreductase
MRMQTRRFGPGGPDLPGLGLGAMSFAGFYGPCSETEALRLLARARDEGIVHVDTANAYGPHLSEARIGAFIAASGNPFHIATKAGIGRDAAGARRIVNSAAHLTGELEASLKRLRVEAVDLFYVHRRDPGVEIEEVAGTLAGLVAAGKARAVGFSEIAPASLLRAQAVHPVAAVQSEYSLATRAPDLGLRQACERIGAALVAFSPVGRGNLTDAPPDAARIAASGFLNGNPRFTPAAHAANQALLAPLRAYAADLGLSTAGLAVAWVLAQGPHVFAIPGTRSPAHLAEMAAGARRGLSPGERTEIERLLPPGWCHGDRYTEAQNQNVERYC